MSDPAYTRQGYTPAGGVLIEEAPDKTMVIVVYALYLAGYVTAGLSTVIGLVIAYVQRGGASPLAQSHYTFLVRTFWMGLVWTLVAGLVALVGVIFTVTVIGMIIGIPLLIVAKIVGVVALIWYGVRCVLGLMAALGDRPYGAPQSWLV